MEIAKGMEIIDLALYLRDFDTLIFADFHVGYEEMLNARGILVPRFQFKDIIDRLDSVFKKFKGKILKRIVVNGDLKHEFGYISEQEWRESLKLLDYLSRHCKELVLVKGNHDTILGPIAEKRNLKIVDHLVLDNILICHGHKIVKVKDKIKTRKNARHFLCPKNSQSEFFRTIIIAHEHPAVTLQEGARVERFKCFLVGNFQRKKLIVMPSFNLLSEGTDVIREKKLSPYFQKNLNNFKVFIVSDKVYDFGMLKNLKK